MANDNVEVRIVDETCCQSRLSEFTKKLPCAIKQTMKSTGLPIHAKLTNKIQIISYYTSLVSTIEFYTDDGRSDELHIVMVDRTRYREDDTVLYYIIHGSSLSGFETCYSDDTESLDALIDDVLPDILHQIMMKRFCTKN